MNSRCRPDDVGLPTDPRVARVADGLLPITLLEGDDTRWTVEERCAFYGCPGLSVAVMEQGEIAWATGFGRTESGGRPVDAQTAFAGASLSKPLTATLALQLVEQGLVSLDAPINGFLSSWKVPENEFTRQAPVTLRWLLSHRAGTTVHGFGAGPPGARPPSALDVLEGRPPAWTPPVRVDKTPGGTARYSGGGMTIVQLLLEEITGFDFATLAKRRIFDPLGMTQSTFFHPLPADFTANAAIGHGDGGVPIPEKWLLTPQLAAGGVYTTARDYAAFMLACRDAWLGKPNALLGQAIAQEMMRRESDQAYGLGWMLLHSGSRMRFGHGGANDGYQAEATCYLERGDGAVVLTNATSGLIFYWEVFNAIADVHGWGDFMRPPKRERKIQPEEFERYVGDYDVISGPGFPLMQVFVEDGILKSNMPGMRGGARQMRMDQDGRFFHMFGPYDTVPVWGPDGKAQELRVLRDGETEVMRVRRRA
ncbi:MAG: serine hydrolase domain-containing protein [Rhizomicrobium sp.]